MKQIKQLPWCPSRPTHLCGWKLWAMCAVLSSLARESGGHFFEGGPSPNRHWRASGNPCLPGSCHKVTSVRRARKAAHRRVQMGLLLMSRHSHQLKETWCGPAVTVSHGTDSVAGLCSESAMHVCLLVHVVLVVLAVLLLLILFLLCSLFLKVVAGFLFMFG